MAEPTTMKRSVVLDKGDVAYCDRERINVSRLCRELLNAHVAKKKARS